MFFKLNQILDHVERNIKQGKGFSMCRMGDGALKFLRLGASGNPMQGINKLKQQGVPPENLKEACDALVYGANIANYISTFEVYYNGYTWHRDFSVGTTKLIREWKMWYTRMGIINENYIHPELGWMMFLNEKRNMFSILPEGTKICCVTNFPKVAGKLKTKGYDAIGIGIPGEHSGTKHWEQKNKTVDAIKKAIQDDFKIFFIGAGEIGRGYYLPLVHENHCIGLDMGNVFGSWNNGWLPRRLRGVCKANKDLTFSLTKKGARFREHF